MLEASGEPVIPHIKPLVDPTATTKSMKQIWDVQLEKWQYQCDYLSEIRKLEETLGRELDAIIAPVAATAAVRHDQFKYYGYATAINLLDFTSVVVPVTFADKELDPKVDNFVPLSRMDGKVQAECESSFPFLTYCIGVNDWMLL